MQVFLPYPDFVKCANVLDNKRLNKQKVESLQILSILDKKQNNQNQKIGWSNHPAVLMFEGFEDCLVEYSLAIATECINRGMKDTLIPKISCFKSKNYKEMNPRPLWFNNLEFFASHRAALLCKNFEHYSKFGWNEKPELNYIWPVRKNK